MSLSYNGTSPTAIKYNGTDLTVLKYGEEAIWSKPYSLTISAGSNTRVTVRRTSSPFQHASTGTLSSGSLVYYGDIITVSYSVSSGYEISTATVNGTTFTSGNSFTVTSSINVKTTATGSSGSWHTVYSGSTVATGDKTTTPTIKDFTATINLPSGTSKLRVTGKYSCSKGGTIPVTTSFSNKLFEGITTSISYLTIYSGKVEIYARSGMRLRARLTGTSSVASRLTLTKVEAYY